MNRQERHAYDLGWAARCVGLPVDVVLGPLRATTEVLVLPGKAWQDAARQGYKDAVCECDHVESDHDSEYGCKNSAEIRDDDTGEVIDTVECPCTGFTSAARTKRQRHAMEAAQRLREAQEDRADD